MDLVWEAPTPLDPAEAPTLIGRLLFARTPWEVVLQASPRGPHGAPQRPEQKSRNLRPCWGPQVKVSRAAFPAEALWEDPEGPRRRCVLASAFSCPGPPGPCPPIETLVVGSTPHGATVSSFVTPADAFCVSSGLWVRLLEASPWPSTAVLCAPAMPLPSAGSGARSQPPGPHRWGPVELLHTEPLTGQGRHHPSCPEAPGGGWGGAWRSWPPGGGGGAPFGEWLLLDPASRRSWPPRGVGTPKHPSHQSGLFCW